MCRSNFLIEFIEFYRYFHEKWILLCEENSASFITRQIQKYFTKTT